MHTLQEEHCFDYKIPKVSVATVATKIDNRSVEDMSSAKVPKLVSNTLMTCIKSHYKRKGLQKRLGHRKEDIHHLNYLLASAKSTEAEDELALAAVNARFTYD